MPDESTTPDLGELVQRVVDAVNAQNVAALMSLHAPDAVFSTGGIGTAKGRDAVRDYFEEWIGTFEDFKLDVEELRDLGNGVTFAVVVTDGRVPDSTGWVRLRYATVATWRDGLIERSANYTDIDEARAAAERLAESRG